MIKYPETLAPFSIHYLRVPLLKWLEHANRLSQQLGLFSHRRVHLSQLPRES